MDNTMVFRRCAITKKVLSRSKLFRLVKTKDNTIFFDCEYIKKGRSIHFSPQKTSDFFNPKKKKMAQHFLRLEITESQWEKLYQEALNSVSHF